MFQILNVKSKYTQIIIFVIKKRWLKNLEHWLLREKFDFSIKWFRDLFSIQIIINYISTLWIKLFFEKNFLRYFDERKIEQLFVKLSQRVMITIWI